MPAADAEWIEEHKEDPAQKSGRQKILAERNARRGWVQLVYF